MKILFLDCDGVINCRATFHKEHDQWFPTDTYMVFLVGKIQLDTDCKIVISSAWRHHDKSVEFLKSKFDVIDITPENPIGVHERGYEIKAWLDAHPEVAKYAIVDDDSDMLPEQLPNFFKTTFLNGLTKEVADAVTKHLNG